MTDYMAKVFWRMVNEVIARSDIVLEILDARMVEETRNEEVEKRIKESEEHAAEDRRQKELIDIRNQADNVIYSVEKTLRDYGEKII